MSWHDIGLLVLWVVTMLFLLWVSSSSNKARSFYSQLFAPKTNKMLHYIIMTITKNDGDHPKTIV
jgi:hypothetical protein